MQDVTAFNQGLLNFLDSSPTPFHAVQTMSEQLQAAGFSRLLEADSWSLSPGGRYYVVRNDSSIVAFTVGSDDVSTTGWRMVGAHTDSPCLRVKPTPEMSKKGYYQLAVEVYGGVLMNPWFDRDLSLAGKVSFRDNLGNVQSALINFLSPIAVIPSLAIHLDREANKGKTVNPQLELPPILMSAADNQDFRELLKSQLTKEHPGLVVETVLDYELSFYDTQPAAVVGFESEFITSARLDNLLSCYVGMQSLIAAADSGQHSVLVCNDHEEVGSMSAEGAQGPMLKSALQRIAGGMEAYARAIDRSMMISVDNAHGVHPNYADKHDENHGPGLNKGPVIKINANQRYASNSVTSSVFKDLAEKVEVPVQSFVVRADMGCGSTIGPITASGLGVKTLDVGVPQFAMHSIREMCGSQDPQGLASILSLFYVSTSGS